MIREIRFKRIDVMTKVMIELLDIEDEKRDSNSTNVRS